MNTKEHYKMFKSGKTWCVMAIATVLSIVGVVNTANADQFLPKNSESAVIQVDNNNSQTNDVSNNSAESNSSVSNKHEVSDNIAVTDSKSAAATVTATENLKNGWVNENNIWTYYTNGSVQNGRNYEYLPNINGQGSNWYLVDNGVAQSGVQRWAGTYYDFDPVTYLKVTNNYVQSQWGDWYLFGNDGRILTGVQRWAGTYYFFDPTTYLKVTNDYRQSQWGSWYMFGPDGKIVTKVYKWAGTYYYFDPTTYLKVTNDYRQSQWGNWYMFGGDGRIVQGFCRWAGNLYFFDPSTYLKVVNTYFNGHGWWNNWDDYWADWSGVVHSVQYFSQFSPVWAGWGCAGAALTMLLSIHNCWPGVGNVIAGIPMGGNGGQIGNQYNGAGFSRVIQPNALTAYAHRWYAGVEDSSGATINQIMQCVLAGHPVLYYGFSGYDAGGARNHCKVIVGYNYNSGLFHVYDPCYYSFYSGAGSTGHTAFDRGANSWITWGQLASEYAGQALTIDY